MNLEEKIEAKIDARNQRAMAERTRARYIDMKICPDCAGDLVDTSAFWRKAFLCPQHYDCKDCFTRHIYYDMCPF